MRLFLRSGSILLVLILGLFAVFWLRGNSGFGEFMSTEKKSAHNLNLKILTKYSYLDGTVLQNLRPSAEFAIGVMIDNAFAARQGQRGLEKAPIVLEAMAEGGVTRFLAIFSSRQKLPEIGPVRSARDYFFDFFKPFHGLYVHAGGSDSVMSELWVQDEVFDVDHGRWGDLTFWRDDSIARPHNLFTSMEALQQTVHESSETGGFQNLSKNVFPFLSVPLVGSKVQSFAVDFPGLEYDSGWSWNAQKKVFSRAQENSESDLTAQNVVVMETPMWPIPGDEKGRMEMQNTGQGKMILFQNGQTISGSWEKETRRDPLEFFSPSGKHLTFLPGKTWIIMVDALNRLEMDLSAGSSGLPT